MIYVKQWDGKKGYIVTITGPMFSEKSGELIKECLNLQLYGKKTFKAFKPQMDNRFSEDRIVSRMKFKYDDINSVNLSIPAMNLPKSIDDNIIEGILKDVDKYDVFAFDEVQFFEGKIIELVMELFYNKKLVILAGLNTSYTGMPFGKIGDLMAISNEVINKVAYCRVCREPATLTQRLVDDMPAPIGELEQIGDCESYEPRCSDCFVPPHKVDHKANKKIS